MYVRLGGWKPEDSILRPMTWDGRNVCPVVTEFLFLLNLCRYYLQV